MKGETERDGWTECESEKGDEEREKKREDGKKLRYMETELGGRRGGREKRVCVLLCVCVVWCKPWVLVDGWI